MALSAKSAAPYKPYVQSPGQNPAGADAFTKAAQTFYPSPLSVPAVTAAAPPPSGGTGGGSGGAGGVNYTDLLSNDPILKQALAGYSAQGIANQGQLAAAQARAVIQRGLVPTGALPGVSGIDPTTLALASQNTAAGNSVQAALARTLQQKQQASAANLAARGLLRSGAYGQHAAENLQDFSASQYQADQQLLDYLQGLYSGFLQQQQALGQQGSQSTNEALQRIIAQIQAGLLAGGTSGVSPPPPPENRQESQPPPTQLLRPGQRVMV